MMLTKITTVTKQILGCFFPFSEICLESGGSYLWEFLLLQIFCDIWVKMLCIAFIETVDLSLLLNPDILVHKYELTNGLMIEEERI